MKDAALSIDKKSPAKGYRFSYRRADDQMAVKGEIHAHLSDVKTDEDHDTFYVICDKGQVECWSRQNPGEKELLGRKAHPRIFGKDKESQITLNVGGWLFWILFEMDANGRPQNVKANSMCNYRKAHPDEDCSVELETFDSSCDLRALPEDPEFVNRKALPAEKVKVIISNGKQLPSDAPFAEPTDRSRELYAHASLDST